jgi:hypothetical protein
MLAKTEMGLAALVAGLATATIAGYPKVRRAMVLSCTFALPAILLVFVVYWLIATWVGWSTLSRESFLFLRSLPPELVYFNKRISGFDQPVQSLVQMLVAALRMMALAAVVGATGFLIGGRARQPEGLHGMARAHPRAHEGDAGKASAAQIWLLLLVSLVLFFAIPIAGAIGWDKGPYLMMPILLLVLMLTAGRKAKDEIISSGRVSAETLALLAVSVYALASLARVVLRVRSGGAYSSYMLPASVILFTYAWVCPFAALFRDRNVSRAVRGIALGLILADVVATAPLLAYRFRNRNTHPVSTARGTIIAVPDLGQAFNEAIGFITDETRPGESVAVMPEGTSLNFLTGRPNPLREEITTPGYLDESGEERAIGQLESSNTRVVLMANRATSEFGAPVFGRDYCRRLFGWVEQNFEHVATFGPSKDASLQIGDKTFFIHAYRKRK